MLSKTASQMEHKNENTMEMVKNNSNPAMLVPLIEYCFVKIPDFNKRGNQEKKIHQKFKNNQVLLLVAVCL